MSNETDQAEYFVVVNDEAQYSIWFAGREIPAGWNKTGNAASKTKCLEEIENVWTDMRPLSLQNAMREEH